MAHLLRFLLVRSSLEMGKTPQAAAELEKKRKKARLRDSERESSAEKEASFLYVPVNKTKLHNSYPITKKNGERGKRMGKKEKENRVSWSYVVEWE